MIMSRQDLKEYLDCELKIYDVGIKRFIPLLITENQILRKHIILLRKCEYYYNTNKKFLFCYYFVRLNRLQNKFSINIPINTCGKGLSIAHLAPIIINGKARIGENCRIHGMVVLGGDSSGAPKLGDNIYIGPGAKIYGDVNVASGCSIGANAVVNKDCFEENKLLVGVPAVVKNKKVSDN